MCTGGVGFWVGYRQKSVSHPGESPWGALGGSGRRRPRRLGRFAPGLFFLARSESRCSSAQATAGEWVIAELNVVRNPSLMAGVFCFFLVVHARVWTVCGSWCVFLTASPIRQTFIFLARSEKFASWCGRVGHRRIKCGEEPQLKDWGSFCMRRMVGFWAPWVCCVPTFLSSVRKIYGHSKERWAFVVFNT